MSDDGKIIELLRAAAPAAPPTELRGKVLGGARDARRRTRRGWFVSAGIAAAWLAIVVSGSVVERREATVTAALLDGARLPAATREADAMARAFEDLPGAEDFARRMRLSATTAATMAPIVAWRERYREFLSDSCGG